LALLDYIYFEPEAKAVKAIEVNLLAEGVHGEFLFMRQWVSEKCAAKV